ncbi:MAG: dimethylargininase [Acidobacteria bacterium]|nr:dimethylargininase [Acidobacteriota bacterium]
MNVSAVTRAPGADLTRCELTYIASQPINVERANKEHRAYESALAGLGVRLISLPSEPGLPDAVFIEDAALVLDEIAVLTRIGAESRRAEVLNLAPVLEQFRSLHYIAAPATLDGGDVLRIGRTLFTGRSTRTNAEGIEQLKSIVAPYDYEVREVDVDGCLHLKTGATSPGDGLMLINRDWIDANAFQGYELIDVPREEPLAANTLRIGDTVLVSASFPKTQDLLESLGLRAAALDISELEKAEAGLTCLSILFT